MNTNEHYDESHCEPCQQNLNAFVSKLLTGLTVYFYPDGKDRILFNGVKSEEGLSKFLIKNLGDVILVSCCFETREDPL